MCVGVRLHIVVDERERVVFRARAAAEGRSLSEWLREAARDRARATAPPPLTEPGALEAFFLACDAREQGREPEWDEHLAVIAASRAQGLAQS